MYVPAVGHLCLWQGGSLWIGHGKSATDIHSHHAVQITISLSGALRMRTPNAPDWRSYRGAVVPSHLPHALEGIGTIGAIIFVEPETSDGRALLQACNSEGITSLPDTVLDAIIPPLASAYETHDEDLLVSTAQEVVSKLAARARPSRALDPRISRAIEVIRERLSGRIVQDEIAGFVFLSPSRFRHLFVEETGIAFRPYVLWLRMERALHELASGESMTNAAHSAGFADLAHMSRTFRRTLGFSPTSMLKVE